MQIWNTQSQSLQPIPSDQVITIYTCGPTVYDKVHIGNLRSFVGADMLRRAMTYTIGKEVRWTMNITDIEDKILKRVGERGPVNRSTVREYTREYEEYFFRDLEAMGVQREIFWRIPRATEATEEIEMLISKIWEKGYAYEIDGSIYFNITKWREDGGEYGLLKKIDWENFSPGHRELSDEYEVQSVGDFALWKYADPETSASWDITIDGRVYPGRPGWHIECSAMQQQVLGDTYHIHTGGIDLVFPHHENEIVQVRCALNRETALLWWHGEHLILPEGKMSKSRGNAITLETIREQGYRSEELRFLFVSAHPRKKLSFSWETLKASAESLRRIRSAVGNLDDYESEDTPHDDLSEAHTKALEALHSDLNLPLVVAELHSVAKKIRSGDLEKTASVADFWDFWSDVLGVQLWEGIAPEVPEEILSLIEDRRKAREAGNYEAADLMRSELLQKGWEPVDGDDKQLAKKL